MAHKTAMHQMLDELMWHEYTIPLELIVRCKELIEVEKEQIVNGFELGERECKSMWYETGKQYYKQTYGGKDL